MPNGRKGSGYHHFSSRAELLGAALERYRDLHTADLVATMEVVGGSLRFRLEQLLGRVLSAAGERGEFRLYASADPLVVACVRRMTVDRLRYLRRLFVEFGLAPPEARRRALIGYFAYLGQGAVADSVPGVLPRTGPGRAALTAGLIDALLA